MKRIILFSLVLAVFAAFGQNNLQEIAKSTDNGNWWTINQNESPEVESFFNLHQHSLGLSPDYSFSILRSKTDKIGIKHHRFEQFYKGLKIEGAQFLLHEQNGVVKSANGRLVKNISQPAVATLTFKSALDIAMASIKTTGFYWEIPEMEALVKELKNDKNATYYPKEELVYVDANYSQKGEAYKLAYKLDLFFEGEHDHKVVFVDANDGAILFEIERCHNGVAHGTANTKYHGTRDIITDSINATTFVLRDVTRGGGIETFNAFSGQSTSNSSLFTDSDNYWNNFNTDKDEVATDAHWSTAQFYDYFLNNHNWDSYDDQGSIIRSYVHWGNNWFNASWNGQFARYGDGNGNPLTSIDVIGHELAHGVTEYSANLVYAYESGALNESFSDIFGTAIEHNTLGSSADWLVGLLDFTLRSMDNPNTYGDPHTYLGNFWNGTSSDNGGVHTNSGVQNYWYYLLSEGGSGTNDNGDMYQVDSLGIATASDIAFRNLAYYLTPSSQYMDARRGSIQAAEDLYGSCSYEVNQVSKAWYAVGVGSDTLSNDVELVRVNSPISSCNMTSSEVFEVEATYFRSGCDSMILAGDSITFGYSLNGGTPIVETLVLSKNLNSGDVLNYTFNQTQDLSVAAAYSVDFWIDYSSDFIYDNDTIRDYALESSDQITMDDSLTFELGVKPHEDNIHFVRTNDNSYAASSPTARNTGFVGFLMTSKDADLNSLDLPQFESENFTKNPSYGSEICMCIDATNWNNVTLEFDLKQTFSRIYRWYFGSDIPEFASSLRIKVDGVQKGLQFHPATYMSDPFVRHYMNLDQYAGQKFELCLEYKGFIHKDDDFSSSSIGDNTYLDNINVANYKFVSIDENPVAQLNVYPNPSNGNYKVNVESLNEANIDVIITDALGRTVYSKRSNLVVGVNSFSISLDGNPAGMYLLQIKHGASTTTKKLMLQ